jgi:hypothetical protein
MQSSSTHVPWNVEGKNAVGRSFLAPLLSCPHGPQESGPTSLASAEAVFLSGFPRRRKRGNENANHRNHFNDPQIAS